MPHTQFIPDEGEFLMKHDDDAVDQRRRRLLLGALAQSLARTPELTEGPFYSDRLPLDQDNDLTMVAGHHAPAMGKINDLTGRILDVRGNPWRGVVIEIWQVDNNRDYIHSTDAGAGIDQLRGKPRSLGRDQERGRQGRPSFALSAVSVAVRCTAG